MNGDAQPPQPAQPVDEPIPFAQPIAYATPATNRRPGLVTAIGVISLVLGCTGILYNGASVLQSVGMLYLTSTFNAATPPPPPLIAATQPVGTLPPINPTTFVTALDRQSGNTLTPEVKQALTLMLSGPGQTHAPPGTLPGQVTIDNTTAGWTTFSFPGGDQISIGNDGKSTSVFNTSTLPTPINPFREVSLAALMVGIAVSVIGLGLSVLLLVAGVLTIRNSFRAYRLHWIFVWSKIAQCVASVASSYWIYKTMFADMGDSAERISMFLATMLAVTLLMSIAYPVGLLFALRAKSVREFYEVGSPVS
ncbi:MAG TPA: hypothetical protein VGN72_06955 [Tepidisphaeraceae bacterium]|nr:hypothetical protein [Tepidisphaeraceae bacterium]